MFLFGTCVRLLAMPSKKAMKCAMTGKTTKKMAMLKKKKAKTVKSKAGTAKIETSVSKRSEFTGAALEASAKVGAPMGGLIEDACEAAHAGAPASKKLRPIWKAALRKTYGKKKAVFAWVSEACLRGKPSCWHLVKVVHSMYDNNQMPEDDGKPTKMVAFLPTVDFDAAAFPKPDECDHPFFAYILCRGDAAREIVGDFVAAVCRKHGLTKVSSGVYKSGDYLTIVKKFPKQLQEAAENLRTHEFDYEKDEPLTLVDRVGNKRKAAYNCITKATVVDEVKRLANMADVDVRDKAAPDWCSDGSRKYFKLSIHGVVHWFNLRIRACRILRHKHLGALPNGGDDDAEEEALTEAEVKLLRRAPLAWKLSCEALPECA